MGEPFVLGARETEWKLGPRGFMLRLSFALGSDPGLDFSVIEGSSGIEPGLEVHVQISLIKGIYKGSYKATRVSIRVL